MMDLRTRIELAGIDSRLDRVLLYHVGHRERRSNTTVFVLVVPSECPAQRCLIVFTSSRGHFTCKLVAPSHSTQRQAIHDSRTECLMCSKLSCFHSFLPLSSLHGPQLGGSHSQHLKLLLSKWFQVSLGLCALMITLHEVREGKSNLSLIARAPMSMGCMSFISKVTNSVSFSVGLCVL